MKKILSLTLVAVLSLALAAPVSAGARGGGGGHGGFRGGVRGGFHHDGFHRFGCCFGPAFVGGVFVGSAFAYPYYGYGYPYYPYAYPYASYYPSGLPAADAGLCGSLNPTRSLLPKRLLPPARRWGDGGLFLGMGASCAGSAPGALSTAGPLSVRWALRERCPALLNHLIRPLQERLRIVRPRVNWGEGQTIT